MYLGHYKRCHYTRQGVLGVFLHGLNFCDEGLFVGTRYRDAKQQLKKSEINDGVIILLFKAYYPVKNVWIRK